MIQGIMAGLAARLDTEPDDLEGWPTLIRSYAVLQDAQNARAATKKAFAHSEGDPEPRAAVRATAAVFGIPLL